MQDILLQQMMLLRDDSMAAWVMDTLSRAADLYVRGWLMMVVRGISYVSVFAGLILFFRDREWKMFLLYVFCNLFCVSIVVLCYIKVLPFWCDIIADMILLRNLSTSLNFLVESVFVELLEGLGCLVRWIRKIGKR